MLGAGMELHVLVERDAFVAQEAGTHGLDGPKSSIETFGQCGNFTTLYAMLEFLYAIAVDVVMDVVVALAAHAL